MLSCYLELFVNISKLVFVLVSLIMFRKILKVSHQWLRNKSLSNKAPGKRKMTAVQLGVPARVRDNPAFKKIDTPEFRKLFTEEFKALIEIFERYGYELRIAGGAVRDILMEKDPIDIDFATTATPEEMKEMFTTENVRMVNANGEKHGTITPRIFNKINYEVTTLRIDVLTDGRRAEVKYTTDWQLDANRRDLTINSMFLGFDGTVYDYFYGYEDLQQRRVVFVGDAAIRIQEDYLRILRYFRFYGRIADEPNKHDSDTIKAIRQHGNGLAHVSGERIWSELQKIIIGNFGCDLMLEILNCELGKYLGLPAAPNIEHFKQVCNGIEKFPAEHNSVLLLTALLNTPEEALQLHARLKFTAFERDFFLYIIEHRDKIDLEQYGNLRLLKKSICVYKENRKYLTQLLKYWHKLELYEGLTSWQEPRFSLTGEILMAHGCKSNPKMKYIIKQLKEIWFDSDFTLTNDELLKTHLENVLKKVESISESPVTKKRRI